MNLNLIARFGVLVAIVALPACSGGGVSTSSAAPLSAVIPQTQSVKLKSESLRSDIVSKVSTSSLRSDVVPAKATAAAHASSLRLVVPGPGPKAGPKSLRSDIVKANTSSVRLGGRMAVDPDHR